MELVDRRNEGLHGSVRVHAHLAEPDGQHVVVVELGHRNPRQGGLRRLVGGHVGIGGQPRKSRQLTVGKGAEKIDNGRTIAGISEQQIVRATNVLDPTSLAHGTIGERYRLLKVVHERKQ